MLSQFGEGKNGLCLPHLYALAQSQYLSWEVGGGAQGQGGGQVYRLEKASMSLSLVFPLPLLSRMRTQTSQSL